MLSSFSSTHGIYAVLVELSEVTMNILYRDLDFKTSCFYIHVHYVSIYIISLNNFQAMVKSTELK